MSGVAPRPRTSRHGPPAGNDRTERSLQNGGSPASCPRPVWQGTRKGPDRRTAGQPRRARGSPRIVTRREPGERWGPASCAAISRGLRPAHGPHVPSLYHAIPPQSSRKPFAMAAGLVTIGIRNRAETDGRPECRPDGDRSPTRRATDVPDEPWGCVDRGSVRDPGGAVRRSRRRPAGGAAVQRGVQYLRNRSASQHVGESAMIALAMLKAEVPAGDPAPGRLPQQGPGSGSPAASTSPSERNGQGVYEAGAAAMAPGQPGRRRQPRLPRDDRQLSDRPAERQRELGLFRSRATAIPRSPSMPCSASGRRRTPASTSPRRSGSGSRRGSCPPSAATAAGSITRMSRNVSETRLDDRPRRSAAS